MSCIPTPTTQNRTFRVYRCAGHLNWYTHGPRGYPLGLHSPTRTLHLANPLRIAQRFGLGFHCNGRNGVREGEGVAPPRYSVRKCPKPIVF